MEQKTLTYFESSGGFLGARAGEEEYTRVRAVRLFPFSDPDKYISIRVGSETGEELTVIGDMADLDPEQRKFIERDLELNYFIPVINKVISIKDEYGHAYFHVMTDKGEVKFTINMSGTNVTKLSETRLLITDINENRFEIRDVRALTPPEQRKLDLFL
ncbi:MAG: DUF1854 domain-containing protein [Lachnospiraceae bacterium]|nr:DUF1854 domain-containing protein [Lachnospiraceae bacterium]